MTDPAQTIRECRVCGESKPVGDFAFNAGKPTRRCKACKAVYEADLRRRQPEKYRAANQRYWERHRERLRAKAREYQRGRTVRRDPLKEAARRALRNAVAAGKVTKADACEDCGTTDAILDGHHDDYSQPFDVVWLCSVCHGVRHRLAA